MDWRLWGRGWSCLGPKNALMHGRACAHMCTSPLTCQRFQKVPFSLSTLMRFHRLIWAMVRMRRAKYTHRARNFEETLRRFSRPGIYFAGIVKNWRLLAILAFVTQCIYSTAGFLFLKCKNVSRQYPFKYQTYLKERWLTKQ